MIKYGFYTDFEDDNHPTIEEEREEEERERQQAEEEKRQAKEQAKRTKEEATAQAYQQRTEDINEEAAAVYRLQVEEAAAAGQPVPRPQTGDELKIYLDYFRSKNEQRTKAQEEAATSSPKRDFYGFYRHSNPSENMPTREELNAQRKAKEEARRQEVEENRYKWTTARLEKDTAPKLEYIAKYYQTTKSHILKVMIETEYDRILEDEKRKEEMNHE